MSSSTATKKDLCVTVSRAEANMTALELLAAALPPSSEAAKVREKVSKAAMTIASLRRSLESAEL